MLENLHYLLQNTSINPQSLESRLKHPIIQKAYPKRTAFVLLQKYAKDFFTQGTEPRMISLVGLRGTGKTTLMWQIADFIYKHHCAKIFFFNINILSNLGISLLQALQEFQKNILQKSFNQLSEPIVFLFDEVQEDEKWASALKILYDEARTAFILCTGSSALLLKNTADLARRMKIEKIYPFKFIEFVTAKTFLLSSETILPEKNLSHKLKEALFFSNSATESYEKLQNVQTNISSYFQKIQEKKWDLTELQENYINYQNIPSFLMYKEPSAITDAILEMLKRVVYEDIPKLEGLATNLHNFHNAEKLLLRLAGSDEINPDSLSKAIGIKQLEINNLLNFLANAEILHILPPYASFEGRILKNRKAFFMSPSLRRALLTTIYGENLPKHFQSKLLEDTIVMYLKRILPELIISFHSASKEANPDIIIETRESPIILEIGTHKKNIQQLIKVRIDSRYNLLVTDNFKEPQIKANTILVPFSWFMLL
jgi:predicted AAA+ superfamily ATPase